MFYDQFKSLCERQDKRPYTVLREIGVQNTHVIVQWQKGSTPRQPTLQKIADYFNVSIDYLVTGEEKQPTHVGGLSIDTMEIAEIIESLPVEQRKLLLAQLRAWKNEIPNPAVPAKSE